MSTLHHILASYVPALVVRALAHDTTTLTTPSCDTSLSAVFCADLSGFTMLTEYLVQRGPEGVEQLSIILNAYFGQLIELVISHGGDIVEFTGDGILALWQTVATDEDLATVTYRAAQCGLAAQHILRDHLVADGFRLTLRVGIGTGEVYIATVGGERGRWELLVAGSPITQAINAQKLADPGQTVLSPQAWLLVQNWCIGYPVGYVHAQEHGGTDHLVADTPSSTHHESSHIKHYVSHITRAAANPPPTPAQPILAAEATIGTSTSDDCSHEVCALTNIRLEDVRMYLAPQPLVIPAIEPTAAHENGLRGHLPAALLARLDAGQSDWIAELRRVTILFINIADLDYTAHTMLDQLQSCIHTIQTVLYHYEGSLNQFIVDDKGTLLIAAMGLPPLMHEDDAARGVALALDIQDALLQQDIRCAIGITTGRIFCGSRGSQQRRDYAIIGDVMNLAARLMSKAMPDSILCDEATCQAADSTLTFEPLPAIVVKGKTDPVPIYRPYRHPPPDVCPLSPIVGRATERAFLHERLQALVQQAKGGIVLIEAEAGMGKSRLIADVVQQAQEMHIASVMGKGDPIEQSTPYSIWRSVFRQMMGLEEAHGILPRSTLLAHLHYDPAIVRVASLLSAVLPLDTPDNEVTLHMTGQVRADNTRDLLLRLLQIAATSTPLLVVLEDANWMDSTSWALTIAVSQLIPSLLLLITTRPLSDPISGVALLRGSLEFEFSHTALEQDALSSTPSPPLPCLAGKPSSGGDIPAEYSHLLRNRNACRLVLDSLSPEDTHALLCQSLGVYSLPEPVFAFVEQKSQGNPFFSQQLLYALRDAGLLVLGDDGTYALAPSSEPLDTLDFPDTIQGIIMSRFDKLSLEQQLTLKVASVIGETFSFHTLRDIYPIDGDKPHLSQHLHACEQLDLVQLETATSDLVYSFKHIITHNVVYNMLLFAQRRELHRAVAAWYERVHSHDLAPFYEVLVYHWSKAEEPACVITYAEQAGYHFLRSFANQEAITFFKQALDLQADQPNDSRSILQHARLEREIGEAYLGLNDLGESRIHLERAAVLVGKPLPHNHPRLAARILRQLLRRSLHRFVHVHCVTCTDDQRERLREAAHTYGLLFRIHYFANEMLPAIYASLTCLNLAERTNHTTWLAYAYANMCIITGSIRLHNWARSYGKRALNIAWQQGDLQTLVYALNINGLYRIILGEWRYARAALEQAVALAKRHGDHVAWAINWALLAQVAWYQGDIVQAHAMFAHLATEANQRNTPLQQAWAFGGMGHVLLRLGRLDEARHVLEQAIARTPGYVERPGRISYYGGLAVAYLRLGMVEYAINCAEAATLLITHIESPFAHRLLEGYAGLAEVYLTLWAMGVPRSLSQAMLRQRAKQACDNLNRYADSFPLGKPRALLWYGRYQWLVGKRAAAVRTWRRCVAVAWQLGMGYEQAMAQVWLRGDGLRG